jgi:hypothetical protein
MRLNKDIFIKRANDIHCNKFNYDLVQFKTVHDFITIQCPIHGCFEQKAYSHLKGVGCKQCGHARSAERRKTTHDDFIKKAKEIHGDKYDYSFVNYTHSNVPVKIICKIHGEFDQTPKSHLRAQGCPTCNMGGRLSRGEFIKRAKEIHGGKYDYSLVNYTHSKVPVTIICKIHGEFNQTPESHIKQRSGCQSCGARITVSKDEVEIYNFVKSLVPTAIQTDRSIIYPKELDVVIPSHKLAIEFNGVYWHNDSVNKNTQRHLEKRLQCEKEGYRLISIRSDIWKERQPQIKSIIKNALQKNKKRIFARKCTIGEISHAIAQPFLDLNHVQGSRPASQYWGMFHLDELVAIMSVTHKQNLNGWELVRFATSCNVVGGLSKMWKYITTVNNINKAISYVDRDLFTGESYKNAGFIYESTTVGFRVVVGKTTESRQKWNKAPDGLTQSEWYNREGVSRIYDSGQDKIVWHNQHNR